MLSALFQVMLPVFLIVGVGFVLARVFTIDQLGLNKVQLYALTPALAYNSLMRTTVSGTAVVQLALGYIGVTAAAGLLAALVLRALPRAGRGGAIAAVMLGNNGNFGLPIALLALGQQGLDQAVVILACAIITLWTVGPVLFGGKLTAIQIAKNVGRLPVIWAMVAALGFRLLRYVPPVGVTSAIDMIAQASIPMILIALGLQLGSAKRIVLNATVLTAVFLRLAIVPLLTLGACWAFGLRGLVLQSLVLAMAMPTAVNTFLLALEYGHDSETVASIVAASTVLSLVTISVVVANLPLLA